MKKKTKRFLTLSSLMILFFIGCAIIFYNLRGNFYSFIRQLSFWKIMELAHKRFVLVEWLKKESVFKEMVLEKNSKIQKTTFFFCY